MSDIDKVFAGSIPKFYDTYFVPLIFEPYAEDLARRLKPSAPKRLLEIAAGTGVVTRALARTLENTSIVATDLNQAMLDHAQSVGTSRPVEWLQADAMKLPFEDGAFDAVVCQFGAMFFPDRRHAFAEAKRVLSPGGLFVFSVWDRIEDNEFADVVTTSLEGIFPEDPPRFMARTPHGYYDRTQIQRDVAAAGFVEPARIDTVTARSPAPSASVAALAYCQGSPLRNEIEARDETRLVEATDVATAALVKRFGSGAIEGKIQAHVITVRKENAA